MQGCSERESANSQTAAGRSVVYFAARRIGSTDPADSTVFDLSARSLRGRRLCKTRWLWSTNWFIIHGYMIRVENEAPRGKKKQKNSLRHWFTRSPYVSALANPA